MSLVAVAGNTCIHLEAGALGVRAAGNKSDVLRIVDVISAPETLWALGSRLEQSREVRHRSVVQVRSPRPDAVDWDVRIAIRLVIGVEDKGRTIDGMKLAHQFRGKGIEPVPVGADAADIFHLPRVGAAERMTAGTLLLINPGAPVGGILLNGEWVCGWF